jgi:hypothetical protein
MPTARKRHSAAFPSVAHRQRRNPAARKVSIAPSGKKSEMGSSAVHTERQAMLHARGDDPPPVIVLHELFHEMESGA